ncbi:MAG: hypothetical protein LJE91_06040 [Gammaproteobacteria bacterium]|nr:hypothetical protein [Gammaproteobacteria bacterium]
MASDRRHRKDRRQRRRSSFFPLFDSSGQPVLWDRRRAQGRRNADATGPWTRDDVPGVLLMLLMLVILIGGMLSMWSGH